MGLPGRFSNSRPALATLIRRVLRGPHARHPRSRELERSDSRGRVAKNRAQSQTRLRPSKRAELVADYEAGLPVKAIGEKYGVHRSTIPMVVRRAGVAVRAAGLDADQSVRASSLYKSGMTLAQTARHLGIGDDAVRQAVLDEGGQIRPRGRRPNRSA